MGGLLRPRIMHRRLPMPGMSPAHQTTPALANPLHSSLSRYKSFQRVAWSPSNAPKAGALKQLRTSKAQAFIPKHYPVRCDGA